MISECFHQKNIFVTSEIRNRRFFVRQELTPFKMLTLNTWNTIFALVHGKVDTQFANTQFSKRITLRGELRNDFDNSIF